KILDERVAAAAFEIELSTQYDFLEPLHFDRPECKRPVRAHFDPGPAVIVVRGGDHGDTWHIEFELGEIGHRRDCQANVMNFAARRHQTGNERHFYRRRIASKIVTGDDLLFYVQFADQHAQAEPKSLHPHEIDFFFQQPARVVFAESGRLYERR